MIDGGIREDTSNFVEDGFIDQQNTTRYRTAELGRRPGFADRNDVGGQVMIGLRETDGDNFIIRKTDDGKIRSALTTYGSSITDLESGLSTTAVGNFAQFNNRTYYTNGTDNVQTITTGTASTFDTGLDAPPVWGTIPAPASTGNIDVGTHLIRYRYVENSTGFVSDPSDTQEVTVTASSAATVTLSIGTSGTAIIRSLDTQADKILVEFTSAGGSVFYDSNYVDMTDSSVVVNITDLSLTQQQRRANGADTGNAKPPKMEFVAEHKARLFGMIGGILYWSGPTRPEGWSTVTQARTVFANQGDTSTGLASFYGDLYIFGLHSIRRLNYTTKPTDGLLNDIETDEGLWNQRCLAFVQGGLYGWGQTGIWKISGIAPKLISGPVDISHNEDVDQSEFEKFHVSVDPNEGVILFFYVSVDNTDGTKYPDKAFCLDLRTQEWSKRDYRHSITASTTCIDSNQFSRCALATNDDTQWTLVRELYDGITSGNPAVATANGTPTTTVIPVNETLQTAQSLKGVMCYEVSTGEERIIASNTSGEITLATALSNAPSGGAEFWLGSSDLIASPKWATGMSKKSRPDHVEAYFVAPSAAGSRIDIFRYKDQGPNPLIWTAYSTDVANAGLSIVNGADHVEVDMFGNEGNGYVSIPLFSDWARSWRLKLVHRKPLDTLRLVHIEPNTDREDQDEVRDE